MSEFQIDYTIRRDGVEIGFGGANGSSINATIFAVSSDIECRLWETAAGMPNPAEVDQ